MMAQSFQMRGVKDGKYFINNIPLVQWKHTRF